MENNVYLPAVTVFSLDELLLQNAQRNRFLEFLSDSLRIGNSIDVEMLRNWGTERIFMQENTSNVVIGAALLLKPGAPEECLTIAGLCYDEHVTLSGQRVLESVVSTWKGDFSNLSLSVDLSKKNDFIKSVAKDLGFLYDEASSDESWSRFVLSAQHSISICESTNPPQPHSAEFICGHCAQKYNSNSNLMRHMVESHGGLSQSVKSEQRVSSQKPYKCDVYQKEFSRKHHLKIHMRIHTGERPYVCDVCQKKFNRNDHLKTHMRIHTDDKPYCCDICQKAFNRQTTLKRHIRIHTGIKSYICDVCQRAFNQSSSLSTHMRIHTGIKPYSCDICQKGFSQKGSLKGHMSVHTGDKPYSCDV
eukprot:945143_1